MAFTYDLDTSTGEVRLYIPDRVEGKARFSDEEIAAFLKVEGGIVKRAAAAGCEVIATSKADTLNWVKTNAIELDGAKPADVILKRAKMLRDQVQDAPTPEEGDEDEWGFVPGC